MYFFYSRCMKNFEIEERLPPDVTPYFIRGYNSLMELRPVDSLYRTEYFVLEKPDNKVANANLGKIGSSNHLLFSHIENKAVIYLCGPISVNIIDKVARQVVPVMATFTKEKPPLIRDLYRTAVTSELLGIIKPIRVKFFEDTKPKVPVPVAQKAWWEIYVMNTKLQIIFAVVFAMYILTAEHTFYFYKPEFKAEFVLDALKHCAIMSLMDFTLYMMGSIQVPSLGDRFHIIWMIPLTGYTFQQLIFFFDIAENMPFDVEYLMDWIAEHKAVLLIVCDMIHIFL